jgi:putative transcriptional regulator
VHPLAAAIALLSMPWLPVAPIDAGRLKAGVFLYATPDIHSPPFTHTVILLVQHGPEGSLGLIVNRPTRTPVREVLDELGPLDLPLHFGGPVQTDAILGLVRSASPVAGASRVLPDVYFATELEALKAAARAPDVASRLRVYAGYAGWGSGQLVNELRQSVWVIGPADARSVFSSEPEALWPRVHDLLLRIEVRLWE